jgi:cytochrome P450
MEKSPIFLGAVGNVNGETGVSLALNSDHTRQRRALGYLFTNSALLQFEQLFQSQIRKFIDVLENAALKDEALDLSSWCKPSPSSINTGLWKFDMRWLTV